MDCLKIRAIIYLVLSAVCIIGPVAYTIIRARFLHKQKKSSIGSLLIISAALVLSIFLLRLSMVRFEEAEEGFMVSMVLVFDSIIETLKTFAVDVIYKKDYFGKLDDFFVALFPKAGEFLKGLFVFYSSTLVVAAPVAGGAIIFQVLASIFPKIRMTLYYIAIWRKKYFFSELNETSIALANGILNMRKTHLRKPVFIFTDAYLDTDDEIRSELFLEAKALGALCIKDDISHVRKNYWGARTYLLIDEDESANLRALTDLCDENNTRYLKKAEIFFVTDSDAYIEIERKIYDRFVSDFKFKTGKEGGGKKEIDEVPTFIPIKSYRNLISNLLVEIPLFEPLIDKEDKSELTVTILGTGHIGTEMFLTTYWMGQILNCKLKINIVSDESENAFWNKIDYINPEIRRTTDENDTILQVNKSGEKNEPYCKVEYICCDAKSSCFVDCINDVKENNLLDTDYYFVSLGSDELNISVANTIKNAVGKYHIENKEDNKAVIAYVVYDSNITKVLNRKSIHSFNGGSSDVLLRAVGNLDDVYSADNVFLLKYDKAAQSMHNAYLKAQGNTVNEISEKEDRIIRTKIHKKRMQDDYKYWANLSRSMHVKYKMFSMGIYYDSVFNFSSPDDEQYKKSVADSVDRYKKIVSGKYKSADPKDDVAYEKLSHELAWLEHRRWNAFTRVKGFRHTDKYDIYAKDGVGGSYKQMELKLHPCLVECDKKGIRKTADGKYATLSDEKRDDFDLLDDLSRDLYKKRYNDYDFKQYDYPIEDQYN